MHNQIKILHDIVTRKGSSKILTFSVPHVFKALQLLDKQKYVSRATFCNELHMGEGAVKTMIVHLKQNGFASSIKSGTFLTPKGKHFVRKFFDTVTAQCNISRCNVARSKYNHAILVKGYANLLDNGMQQRDYAILYGAHGATTLAYIKKQFVFPGESINCLSDDPKTMKTLIENLHPEENDIVIISSSDDLFVAEISAINSVLWTLATHEKHG